VLKIISMEKWFCCTW